MILLRPYQQEAVQALVRLWEGRKWRRLLLTCATGLGKTVIFCHAAKAMNARTLILAHRDELCSQAAAKMEAIWEDAGVGIVKADKNQLMAQVVVASVQTLARPERLAQLPRFDLIIVDEAHHAPAKTYRGILKALGAWEPDGPLVVGVTATPRRADDLGLDSVFQKVAYSKGLLEGIREGYLTDLVGKRIKAELDLSGVKLVAGDYDESQLAHAVNQDAFNNLVVEAYKKEAPGRLAVVFTCSVEHAQAVAQAFCAAGIPAAHVDGEMKEARRRAILDDFEHRRISVITNCHLLTEGWDCPAVDCVIMARPTRSQTLYIQAVGRGARPYPGKENCIVLDLVGASAENSLVALPTIFGLPAHALDAKGGSILRAIFVGQPDKPATAKKPGTGKVAKWEAEAVDLFGRAAMRWLQVDDGALCLVAGDSTVFLVAEEKGWSSYRVKGNEVHALTDRPLAITYAQGTAEDAVRQQKAGVLAAKDAAWRSQPISPAQIDKLRQYGIPLEPDMQKGRASDLITVAQARERLTFVLARRKGA